MKRLIALLAVLCMALSFAACSAQQTAEPEETSPDMGNPGDPEAYYFTYKGTEIRLNADMEVILNAWENPRIIKSLPAVPLTVWTRPTITATSISTPTP